MNATSPTKGRHGRTPQGRRLRQVAVRHPFPQYEATGDLWTFDRSPQKGEGAACGRSARPERKPNYFCPAIGGFPVNPLGAPTPLDGPPWTDYQSTVPGWPTRSSINRVWRPCSAAPRPKDWSFDGVSEYSAPPGPINAEGIAGDG